MRELHVVFCVLKVIGKLIHASGLNQAFQEAGMTTNNCIKFDIRTSLYSAAHFWEIGTSMIKSNM